MNADGRVSGRDWRWALTWTAVILTVSCLPYLVAWVTAPPGYQFSGILVNPYDGNSYLAKMRQGWAGAWQFHLTYSPEPHDGAYIFLFYLGLGHIARLATLPLIPVYHAARLLAGLALLMVVYAFLVRLTDDRFERRLAFLLVGTAAGLGWLGVGLGTFPIDLWVPEAFPFFSLLSNPHFSLAMALMLLIIAGVVWPAPGAWRWLRPGLAALALVVVQPFALAAVYITLTLYLLLRGWIDHSWPRPGLIAAAGAVLFSAPVLLYDYWVYMANPALAAWSTQNVTAAPPAYDLILGFGLVGLLAIPGGVMVVREREPGGLAMLAWAAGALALVYVPLDLQRRFLTGLGLPLAMLAAIGLQRWILSRLTNSRARLMAGLVIGLSMIGNLFLLAVLTLGVLDRGGQADLFARLYLTRDETSAMQWLLANAQDEVVLAAPRTGILLPGRGGVRVFVGHPFETIDADAKEAQAEAFFRGEMIYEEWQALREQYQIHYLFVGPAERALGNGGERLPEISPAYQQGEVTIYRLP